MLIMWATTNISAIYSWCNSHVRKWMLDALTHTHTQTLKHTWYGVYFSFLKLHKVLVRCTKTCTFYLLTSLRRSNIFYSTALYYLIQHCTSIPYILILFECQLNVLWCLRAFSAYEVQPNNTWTLTETLFHAIALLLFFHYIPWQTTFNHTRSCCIH